MSQQPLRRLMPTPSAISNAVFEAVDEAADQVAALSNELRRDAEH